MPYTYIVAAKTKRSKRGDMLHLLLKPGNTVVVVSERDLGRGVELKNIKAFLAKNDISLVSEGGQAEEPKTKTRGLSDEQKAIARKYWHLPGHFLDYINEKLADAGLEPATRNHLRYALGERGTHG